MIKYICETLCLPQNQPQSLWKSYLTLVPGLLRTSANKLKTRWDHTCIKLK